MFRMLFPQNDLNSYMFTRLKLVKYSLCRKRGGAVETVDHILCECPVISFIDMFPNLKIKRSNIFSHKKELEKFLEVFLK